VNRFEAHVRRDGGVAVIEMSGTIDGDAEHALDAAYAECNDAGTRSIALGFDAVDYMNSTGIALLVSVLARAKRDGRPVCAWGLSDHYREIFELTRLADFLEVYPDEAAARAGVANKEDG
jgi:anti-anti-sigma factor